MGRLIESFDYGEYVTFVDFQVCNEMPKECVAANYNMDAFIEDDHYGGYKEDSGN